MKTYGDKVLVLLGWTEGSAVGISVGSVVETISITLKTHKNVKKAKKPFQSSCKTVTKR